MENEKHAEVADAVADLGVGHKRQRDHVFFSNCYFAYHLGDMGADGRVILKQIARK